jgi:uncharacterized protein (DUF2267 family)
MTGLATFDETIEKTNAWLQQLEAAMGWGDRHKAYMALRAVLHALRDRLLPNEAVDLAAQLPMLVRGFFYEGWRPADKPRKYRHKQEFLDQVTKEAPWLEGEELERAVTAVFGLLSSEVSSGETAQVRRALPAELRELWTQPGL